MSRRFPGPSDTSSQAGRENGPVASDGWQGCTRSLGSRLLSLRNISEIELPLPALRGLLCPHIPSGSTLLGAKVFLARP